MLNLDTGSILRLVDDYLASKTTSDFVPPVIGLRINPVVGVGKIASMSTAGKQSKVSKLQC